MLVATMIFQQGVDGYNGSFDTMLRQSKSATSFATAPSVNVDGADSAGQLNQGLLYFNDIFGSGPRQIPVGAVITSATLTLNVTDGTSERFSLHRMLTDWTAVPNWTWNALGNGIQTDGTEAATTADATVASIAAGSRSINVLQSLQAWADGVPNFGWALLMTGSNGWDFNSSEGAVAPTLTVDYTMPADGIGLTETGGSTSIAEGGQGDSILVALNSAPTANVTISMAGNSDVGTNPATLTFTSGNWQTPQSVTLAAVDDAFVEGTEIKTVTLSSSSADAGYNGLSTSVNVTISDNDSSSPVVVAIHDTTQYKLGDPSRTGCCDPSGLAYVPELNRLFIADSEHDESPFNSPTNLFAVTLGGTQATLSPSYSLTGFTREPTGLEYNPSNGYLYITSDDARKVFWVNPENPSVKVGEFSLNSFGILDAEDPEFDQNGHMYILSGVTQDIFEFMPTSNGSSFTLVRSVSLPSVITDAEGLAYDAARDVFYIASGATRGKIFALDHDMNLLSTLELLDEPAYRNPIGGSKPKIKGLELAPSSNPNDGDHLSLYAADYGADQKADGRLFEIDLHPDWLVS